ncbi:hypothetical protein A3H10_01430 [Candidatus Uhrbacteria bacterium RIFCSPLOWO2_12_FULL_46_10]|uniref:Uncharacterized protein n=1 Tax=Candidatus Uhrbacteria bacterium RIFCSPLOWO2_01_FULL_47_25 TaxID=1802402 RepID=A0A1F7UZ31_9BACT|nr:MAG: Heat shock protein [Candidatus Saccharibacteria bacterium GW2011_GWA2_46_10]OGL59803.1 MAG: hypothetical protein A2752_01720 [Candidatus Uhrbacteria bacterium RIFCSPHIGHO2_01_FULL_46_23]OGL70290.1 MAG: hypothetical protein A3D60_01675 [Candidatus Uhrbacteria bacterium RIFCSPHIGHO2_02_FULL_47_29]OGL76050.1 MAG: hypothetical protein A3E96_00575 [Candidatus Uhrbacteria bacterium RIFCSPHIGHO2_12_FULL_46_13]OGL82977.1 MAG: hypothetical protein A2936_03420 [Candidatus Uhrbacteria bacterium RI
MSSIIRWSPIPWLPDDLDKFINGFGRFESFGFTPPIDIYQTNEDIIVEAPLPAVNPEDVEVTVEHDVLTIQGKSEQKSEVDEKNYYRREVRRGSFYRSVNLSAAVDGDKAEATYERGILKIKIPKTPAVRPKAITVKASGK